MKYLLIFLPIFCFAQGGDSTLYGVRSVDTCWQIKDGWMSLKPGCISIPSFSSSGEIINFKTQEFYVSDRKPKVIESFKYLGAYYELRENGWYKKILPDTIPKNRDTKGDSVFQWVEIPRNSCDQHIGARNMPKRDKIDRTRAKILVWNGCTVMELEAWKVTHYNEMTVAKDVGNLAIYISETIKVDTITEYLYDGGWIKNSHVIKEL